MQLNSIAPTTKNRKNAPVGRGGTRGKTSGRGGKGQTARAGHKIRPEVRDLIKKLPKRRGHGKNRSRTVRTERKVFAPINIGALEMAYNAGERVSPASLVRKGLVRRTKGRAPRVKVLGTGELAKALVFVGVSFSTTARTAVEKSGSSIAAE